MSEKKTMLKLFRKAVVEAKKSLKVSKVADLSGPMRALSSAADETAQKATSLISKFTGLEKLGVTNVKAEKKAAHKEKIEAYIVKAVAVFEKKVLDIDAKIEKITASEKAKAEKVKASAAKKKEAAAKKSSKKTKSPKTKKSKKVHDELSSYLFGF